MGRPKGLAKTGGRETGTPNVMTRQMRNVLKELMFKQLETLPDLLNNLSTDRRIEIIIKLLPFVVPQVKNVHMEMDEPDDVSMFYP